MTYSFQPVTPDARHRAARARRSSLDDFNGGFHFGIDEATALRSFDADGDPRAHMMCTHRRSAPQPSHRASKMTRPPLPRQEAQVITDESAHGDDGEGHHPSWPPSFDDSHRREISANFHVGHCKGSAPSYDNWPRSLALLERTRASPQSARRRPGVVRRDRSVASLALGSVPLQMTAPAPTAPDPTTERASHLSFLAAMGQSQRSRGRVDVHCNDELRRRMDESNETRTALMKWARGALKGGAAVPGPLHEVGTCEFRAPFPSRSPGVHSGPTSQRSLVAYERPSIPGWNIG